MSIQVEFSTDFIIKKEVCDKQPLNYVWKGKKKIQVPSSPSIEKNYVKYDLKTHEESKHEGIFYNCNQYNMYLNKNSPYPILP